MTGEERLASLAAMARALGRRGDLEDTVERAAVAALAALDAASVSVSRLEPGTGTVRVLVNVGDLGPGEERWPTDERYPLTDFTNLLQVVEERRAWFASVSDGDLDLAERALLVQLGKASALGAPVVVDDVLWGELYATRAHGQPPFTEADRAYVEALSAIMGSALARDIQVAALRGLAFRDPLTGLHNRRALDGTAQRALDEHAASGEPVTLAVLDVDGLKQVNDRDGHVEGDRLLIAVAYALTECFAPIPGALVARVGGDEFCVLVTGRSSEEVAAAARRACTRPLPGGAGLSCGVAAAAGPDRLTFEALYAAADAAQYRAKRTGGRHTRTGG